MHYASFLSKQDDPLMLSRCERIISYAVSEIVARSLPCRYFALAVGGSSLSWLLFDQCFLNLCHPFLFPVGWRLWFRMQVANLRDSRIVLPRQATMFA